MAFVCVQTIMSQVLLRLGDVIPAHTDLSSCKSLVACHCTLRNIYSTQCLALGKCLGLNNEMWYVEIKCQLDATEVFIADLQTGRITLSSTPDQLLEKTTAQNTTRSNHCIILLSS